MRKGDEWMRRGRSGRGDSGLRGGERRQDKARSRSRLRQGPREATSNKAENDIVAREVNFDLHPDSDEDEDGLDLVFDEMDEELRIKLMRKYPDNLKFPQHTVESSKDPHATPKTPLTYDSESIRLIHY